MLRLRSRHHPVHRQARLPSQGTLGTVHGPQARMGGGWYAAHAGSPIRRERGALLVRRMLGESAWQATNATRLHIMAYQRPGRSVEDSAVVVAASRYPDGVDALAAVLRCRLGPFIMTAQRRASNASRSRRLWGTSLPESGAGRRGVSIGNRHRPRGLSHPHIHCCPAKIISCRVHSRFSAP